MRERGRKVPVGLPHQLRELRAALGTVNDIAYAMDVHSGTECWDSLADALWSAFSLAREFARVKNVTGCTAHPQGAVDPLAPEGWGKCLLCNDRRRGHAAGPGPRMPRPRTAPPQSPPDTPTPPSGTQQGRDWRREPADCFPPTEPTIPQARSGDGLSAAHLAAIARARSERRSRPAPG